MTRRHSTGTSTIEQRRRWRRVDKLRLYYLRAAAAQTELAKTKWYRLAAKLQAEIDADKGGK